MKKLLLFLSFTLLLATACSKKSNDTPQQDSLAYFTQHLQAGMSYNAIVNAFGEPDGDIGSGIHIYVYHLSDGSSIYIGYNGSLLYAKHVSSSGQFMHDII